MRTATAVVPASGPRPSAGDPTSKLPLHCSDIVPADGDEVTGEKDLIALHTLGNIANWVLGPQFRPGNYEQGLTGLGGRPDWRK